MPAAIRHHVGRFEVATDADAAKRCAAITTLSGSGETQKDISAVLPMVWLGAAEVWDATMRVLAEAGLLETGVLVHVSQEVALETPLGWDRTYVMDVHVNGPNDDRLILLEAVVRDADDTVFATMMGKLAVMSAPEPSS